jgi:hypothetical protein
VTQQADNSTNEFKQKEAKNVCNICEKRFKNNGWLFSHMKTHKELRNDFPLVVEKGDTTSTYNTRGSKFSKESKVIKKTHIDPNKHRNFTQ